MKLRTWLLIGLLAVLLAACQAKEAPTPSPTGVAEAETGAPFKIGVLTPLTGPQADLGRELVNGVRLFFSQNPVVAGRRVELIVEDDASNPQLGLTKAQKLVEQDRVEMLFGIINSAVLASVMDYASRMGVPVMSTNASTQAFTAPPGDPLRIRVAHAQSTDNLPAGWYAYARLGWRRVATITWDFLAGREQQDFFKQMFTRLGGEIVQEQFAPLGTAEWGPYISRVPANIDGLYVFLAGADGIRFMQQAHGFGLTQRVKIMGIFTALTDVLPHQPDAAVGHYEVVHYFYTLDTPENRDFVAAYRRAYNSNPTVYAAEAYAGALVVAEGLKAVRGNTSDRAAFVRAMRSLRVNTPMGPVRFDDYGQAILNVYVARIERQGGEYRPVIIDTIPEVGQFWQPPAR